MNHLAPIDESSSTPLSPITPTSPTTQMYPSSAQPYPPSAPSALLFDLQQIYTEYKQNEELLVVFKDIGLQYPTKITDSLQGSVWRAYSFANKEQKSNPLIMKITDKSLHQRGRAMVGDQEFIVYENMLKERKILKYINQQKQCPQSIVKYKDFLQTDKHLCLIMEDCGGSLFDLVQKAHRFIKAGNLEVSEWNKTLKIMFKQMFSSVSYIHSHNIAHFDISLENFLINDLQMEIDEYQNKKWKMRFVAHDIHVKLCDFGLSEMFQSNKCLSSKFCGKRQYKSPEIVYQRKSFDAKKNDVWCLGVCWFAMCIGCIPWSVAHESDPVFSFLSNHSVAQLLEHWNISNYVDAKLISLFDSIFQEEEHRMSISDIKKYLF